jgi:hypothetical protein
MWRSRTRLPMWVPSVFTVGRHPAPGEERYEEAVLVTFRAPRPAQAPDFSALEEAVGRALREARTGELEGIQRGPGTVTVLAYGEDAERLWASMEGAVRTFPCRPADVTLRYGLVGAPDRTLEL